MLGLNVKKPFMLDRVKYNISNLFFQFFWTKPFFKQKRRRRYLQKLLLLQEIIDDPYVFGYLLEEMVLKAKEKKNKEKKLKSTVQISLHQ